MKRVHNILLKVTLLTVLLTGGSCAQDMDGTYLIVRGDDIGSQHAANIGCIESYREGIVRTVEVMVPCSWFLEAAEMLRENPGLDVGVHLTLTSEWDTYKWGPLTCAPSLVDSNGYFYPRQKNWSDPDATNAFWNANPDMDEVEAELRAQIEMAMKHIPQISHVTGHMGIYSEGVSPEMNKLVKSLVKEYGLDIIDEDNELNKIGMGKGTNDSTSREDALLETLQDIQPGFYLMVTHPGQSVPEMNAIGHDGNTYIGNDRGGETDALTSERVKQLIADKDIKLISYTEYMQLKK